MARAKRHDFQTGTPSNAFLLWAVPKDETDSRWATWCKIRETPVFGRAPNYRLQTLDNRRIEIPHDWDVGRLKYELVNECHDLSQKKIIPGEALTLRPSSQDSDTIRAALRVLLQRRDEIFPSQLYKSLRRLVSDLERLERLADLLDGQGSRVVPAEEYVTIHVGNVFLRCCPSASRNVTHKWTYHILKAFGWLPEGATLAAYTRKARRWLAKWAEERTDIRPPPEVTQT